LKEFQAACRRTSTHSRYSTFSIQNGGAQNAQDLVLLL